MPCSLFFNINKKWNVKLYSCKFKKWLVNVQEYLNPSAQIFFFLDISQHCSNADFIHSQFVSSEQTSKLSKDKKYRYSTKRAHGLWKKKKTNATHIHVQAIFFKLTFELAWASTIHCYFTHQNRCHFVTQAAVHS